MKKYSIRLHIPLMKSEAGGIYVNPALGFSSPQHLSLSIENDCVLLFEVQTSYRLIQVWLTRPKLKVKLYVSIHVMYTFWPPAMSTSSLSCIHKAFLNTLAALCESEGSVLTQALLGGEWVRGMRSGLYIFSQWRQWLRAQRWVSAAGL